MDLDVTKLLDSTAQGMITCAMSSCLSAQLSRREHASYTNGSARRWWELKVPWYV